MSCNDDNGQIRDQNHLRDRLSQKESVGKVTGKVQVNNNGFNRTELAVSRRHLNKTYRKMAMQETLASVCL